MTTSSSRLVTSEEGGVTRVGFVDRNILEEAFIQRIGDEISALVDEAANPKILLNFENVEHLSSAALGTLITVNQKVRNKGGQLRLCNIDKQIYEVFVITKLNKLFQIHDDIDGAMKSFK
ncbi:MAG: STAS domain-containing protein [Planctomycetota bacterium]